MKKKFSAKWKASVQPRKQRKYLANAPLHAKQGMMKSNLSKELRKKHCTRSVRARKGDTVKILRGIHKGKTGKIEKVDRKNCKLFIEGIKFEKKDGTKTKFGIHYSNVQIIDLDLSDIKRLKNKEKKVK